MSDQAPQKRCRSKLSPAQAALKSPNPKKLRKLAKSLQSPAHGPASASTTTPDSILKKARSPTAVARKLSFGSSTTHNIKAENEAPKAESISAEAGSGF